MPSPRKIVEQRASPMKLIQIIAPIWIVLNTVYGQGSLPELLTRDEFQSFYDIANSPLASIPGKTAWTKAVPGIDSVAITSSSDGKAQPALFYDSGSPQKKPLLVVLHSWSADFMQHFSIPYGVWSLKNDWVFIHPDYRGPYDNAEATASEAAVRDILDAVEYAKKRSRVDEQRIYLTGFSGGAMTTLIMVGRFPDIWAGAAAWVPVYDLVDWYYTTKGAIHDYSHHIENSCGGPPLEGTAAYAECKKRSVSSYLKKARGKEVQVYIAAGIRDNFVPVGHAVRAFNDLANSPHLIPDSTIDYLNREMRVPPQLKGTYYDSLFSAVGHELVFERSSGNVTLKIFEGRHDVLYNPSLLWLSRQSRTKGLFKGLTIPRYPSQHKNR